MGWNNRILVIDDQENIHEDFEKVLGTRRSPRAIPEEAGIFSTVDEDPKPAAKPEMGVDEYEALILGGDPGGDDLFADASPSATLETSKTELSPDSFLKGKVWYRIDHAGSGEEGLNKVLAARESGEEYAVVFVDVRMPPGIDGIETAAGILKACPYTEIVVVSAFSDFSWEEMLRKLRNGSRFHFLGKPFNRISLKQMAFNCTLKWNRQRQIREKERILSEERDYYQRVVHYSGTVTLEEDFSPVLDAFEQLKADGVRDLSTYLEQNKRAVADFAEMITVMDVRALKREDVQFDIASGARLSEVLYSESLPIFKQQLVSLWNGETTFEGQFQKKNKNGDPVNVHLLMMSGHKHARGHVTVSLTAEPLSQEDYLTDPLTRLPNRELFDIHLDQTFKEFERVRRTPQGDPGNNRFALMFIDLNDFKRINDEYDHTVGDEMLKAFADRLRRYRRGVDVVARRGGDEFTILVRGLRDYDNVKMILDNLKRQLTEPVTLAGQTLSLSASVGCAVCPEDTDDMDLLVRYADQAMYQAKRGSRDDFRVMQWRQLAAEGEEIKRALREDRLHLRFVPIQGINGRAIGGQTAILLEQENGKTVNAGRMLGLPGLAASLEPVYQWLFENVADLIDRLREESLPTSMFLDIGGAPLRNTSLIVRLEAVLTSRRVPTDRLILQLPESAVARAENAEQVIRQAQNAGFRICLGDHDPGGGPWALYRHDFDAVKILAGNLDAVARKRDQELYLGVLSLISKNNPDIRLVGCDITTKAQMDLLADYGFHAIEGPFVADMMDTIDYIVYLTENEHDTLHARGPY